MCSILATQNPNVGLAIAYPIMQVSFSSKPYHTWRPAHSLQCYLYNAVSGCEPLHWLQSGLCIAGLWGIILFRELRGREQVGYWISSVVLIVGATLLTLSK